MSFCHLHLHTDASLLDGMIQIERLVDRVAEHGQKAVAVTDHGVLANAVKLTKAAKDKGVKPIIGCEVYMATGDMEEDAQHSGDNYHLTLLARTQEGYRNLCRLTTEAHARGFSYKPRIDRATLRRYSEGITVLSGCVAGELSYLLTTGKEKQAVATAKWFRDVFGEHYHIELMSHGATQGVDHVQIERDGEVVMTETDLNLALVGLADKLGIGIVATNDAHYLEREDGPAHDTLLCLSMGKWKSVTDRLRFPGAEYEAWEFYVKDEQQMLAASRERWWETACINTATVADQIEESVLQLGQQVMPVYEIPEDPGFEMWKRTGLLL